MSLSLCKPITYLITSGETTAATKPSTEDFSQLLSLVTAAVSSGINLIQLREKNLEARVLYELTMRAVALTRGSATKLVVNDRADIALTAGADGVHLAGSSMRTATIRATFGDDFVIGVSSHSLSEARSARDEGADFVVFGPVFETVSKRVYGEPRGLSELEVVTRELAPFPVLALGGVTLDNSRACLRAGAAGIAGISLFSNAERVHQAASLLRSI